jgi:hypothetical protein
LKAIKRIEVWGEGALGKVHLEIQSISASTSSYSTQVQVGTQPDKADDLCSGPVQPSLRYNISSRTTPDVPVPVGDGENLAEAVCCDKRTLAFAEPQFLFQAPDIGLFAKLETGVTTFYDSVCGVPFSGPQLTGHLKISRLTQQSMDGHLSAQRKYTRSM